MRLSKQMIMSLVHIYEVTQMSVYQQFLDIIFQEDPYLTVQNRRKKYALAQVVRHLFNFRMPRSVWEYPRHKGFWQFFKENSHHNQWVEHFRTSKETVMYVHSMLRDRLKPKFNRLQPQRAIESDEQVAIYIFFLCSCSEYRVIGLLFGYAKCTICKIVRKVCQAILDILMPIWITIPNYDECIEISKEFEEMCNIPQIILVIDGTHIPVTPSMEGRSDFFNRKGWPSIVLQVAVDHRTL